MEYNELKKITLETGKEFIDKFVAPLAKYIDENEEFPMDNFKEMGRLGLFGIPYSQELGGIGLDYKTYLEFIREIAMNCASTAMTVISHVSLSCSPIYHFGTDLLKAKFLMKMITGEKIGSFALTEPNAGSDIVSMTSTAIEKEDHFLLNGSKIFITNANVADVYIVAAKTSPEKKALGISLFILEKGMEGVVNNGKKERKLGMCGSDTGELAFQNVKIPKENLIGKKDFGIMILHKTLMYARLGMAAIGLGISKGAQNLCVDYIKQRKQFGKNIYHFQSIKNMIAEMEMHINAASLLLDKAIEMKDRDEDITKESSEAKLFASETAMKTTRDAVQIFGGYGYSKELPLERFYRDAKLTEIGDGTSQIQKLIIADEILKKKIC